MKRKLYFYRWSPSKGAFVTPSESEDPSIAFWPLDYTIIDTAKSLQFQGTERLLIALRTDYLILNLRSLEVSHISPSSIPLLLPNFKQDHMCSGLDVNMQ